MPNRIIKESVCASETLDGLSWFQEVFFYRLIVNCDDFGRFDARPAILKARLFPLKSLTDKQITDALNALSSVGIVDLYYVDGRPFLQIVTWSKHQQTRSSKSKFPAPDGRKKANDEGGYQLISNDIKRNQLISNVPVIVNENVIVNDNENERDTRMRATPPADDGLSAVVVQGLYNDICVSLPQCVALTDARRRKIKKLTEKFSLDEIKCIFEKAQKSAFLAGKNDRSWKAAFDWVIDEKNAVRIFEGVFDNVKSGKATGFDIDEFFELATKRGDGDDE